MSKPEQIFVKPCTAGAIIRDPRSPIMVLPDDGAWRPNNSFWNRRIIQKDVFEADPPKTPEDSEPVVAAVEAKAPKSQKPGQKGGKR